MTKVDKVTLTDRWLWNTLIIMLIIIWIKKKKNSPASTMASYVASSSFRSWGSIYSTSLGVKPKKPESNLSKLFTFPLHGGIPHKPRYKKLALISIPIYINIEKFNVFLNLIMYRMIICPMYEKYDVGLDVLSKKMLELHIFFLCVQMLIWHSFNLRVKISDVKLINDTLYVSFEAKLKVIFGLRCVWSRSLCVWHYYW